MKSSYSRRKLWSKPFKTKPRKLPWQKLGTAWILKPEIGDELLSKLDSSMFGRIAAQAAKQNIVQRVRDAEREIIYNEFKGREGQLVNGIVQRFEKRNIIVNLGRTDAILPEKEQVPRERYRQGDRIRAYIVSVEITSRGPQIILSRTHPGHADPTFRAGSAGDL